VCTLVFSLPGLCGGKGGLVAVISAPIAFLERFTMALHTHTDHETTPEYRLA
jgi:hypothetical protein